MRVTLLFCTFALVASAQSPDVAVVRGESASTRQRLMEAERLLNDGKAVECRTALLKVIEDAGDDLIHIGQGQYAPARRHAQALLSKLPSEVLNGYLKNAEPAARTLLTVAVQRRDDLRLRRVVDRFELTAAAQEAREALAELAFERGDFATAEREYEQRQLQSNSGTPPRIEACRISCVIFQNDLPRAAVLIGDFDKRHPIANGSLAGKDGNLVATLKAMVLAPPKLPPATPQSNDWSTLGGSVGRSGSVPGSLLGLPSQPAWSRSLPGVGPPTDSIATARRIAVHPIFDARYCYVPSSTTITAYDLESGTPTTLFNFAEFKKDLTAPGVSNSEWRDADFGLTLHGGSLYARVGPATVLPPEGATVASTLIRLDTDEPGLPPRRVAWSRKPPVPAETRAGWEGAPVVAQGRLFAAFSRLESGRTVLAIACYEDRGQAPLWVTDVAESSFGGRERRERHELLTVAGGNAIICSQTGVIAAVDLETGKHAWSHRYVSIAAPRLDGRHRDIAPPVAADGRVFVAPNDSDTLFAFDSHTGDLAWRSGPLKFDSVLGVSHGLVIASLAGPQRGMRAYDIRTGREVWQNHDDRDLVHFGRGVIIGDHIAWPTQQALYVLRLSDGLQDRMPLPGPQGNLAFAAGHFVVATSQELRYYRLPAASASPAPTTLRIAKSASVPPPEPLLPPTIRTPAVVESVHESPAVAFPVQQQVLNDGARIVRVDEHHVARIEAGREEPSWIRSASGRNNYSPYHAPTAFQFDSHFLADDQVVIVRRTDGLVQFLDSHNGKERKTIRTHGGAWTTPPLRWNDHRTILPIGMSNLMAVDGANFKPIWTYNTSQSASLNGAAIQVARGGSWLFALVKRNHGLELDRIDPAVGMSTWPGRTCFLDDHGETLSEARSVGDMLFVPGRDRVSLISGSGTITAQIKLPTATKWRLHEIAGAMVAVPLGLDLPMPRAEVVFRNRFTQILAAAVAPETPAIVIFDSATGEVRQTVESPGVLVDSRVTVNGLQVTTARRLYRIR